MTFTLKENNKTIWLNFNYIVRFFKNEDGSCTIITENESICVKNSFESIWKKLEKFELTI